MAKKIIFYLILVFVTPRHLQSSYSPKKVIIFAPKKLKLFVKDQSQHCRLRLKKLDIYKSIYCFKRIKKKEGLSRPSWIITTSTNPPKSVFSRDLKPVIFFSMRGWDKVYFFGSNSEKGT